MSESENLPTEISRGTVIIGPLEIEVVQLDNGERVITEESMKLFLQWISDSAGPVTS
jgi:uncharacterized SAM-dependent methyltransferase